MNQIIGSKITWPEQKDFAFTIFDDTDFVSLEKVVDIYAFLQDCGFRTTKSVWVTDSKKPSESMGETCDSPEYLAWVLQLQEAGFEIGYHMTTGYDSLRPDILEGLEKFNRLFRHYPRSMANHMQLQENVYWGDARLNGIRRHLYNLLTKNRNEGYSRGHIPGDPHFWGDLCLEKISFVRNFVFPDINTLKSCAIMPYHDPQKPYVNNWFASADGGNIERFNRCLNEANQDRLEEEGGACIIYTHLATKDFFAAGRVNPRFRTLLSRLSKKNGWFVPVADVLNYILKIRGPYIITDSERSHLEWKWLWYKMVMARTS